VIPTEGHPYNLVPYLSIIFPALKSTLGAAAFVGLESK